jgi:hypothetical protein
MTDPDPLRVRDSDPLTKWRRDAAERAEEAAREQRAEERERRERERQAQQQEHDAIEVLRREIDDVRTEAKTRIDVSLEVIADKVCEAGDRILDVTEQKILAAKNEMFALVDRRFGELMGRLDGFLSDTRSRRFRGFANESEAEIAELPNWRKTH